MQQEIEMRLRRNSWTTFYDACSLATVVGTGWMSFTAIAGLTVSKISGFANQELMDILFVLYYDLLLGN